MTILKLSLLASMLILVIVVIRTFAINKLPKKTFLILWVIALCRLLLPFSVPSHLSAYNAVSHVSKGSTEAPLIETILFNTASQITASSPIHKEAFQAAGSLPSISPYVIVWLTGAVLLAVFFLVTHLRCRREYRTALPINDPFLDQWLADHPTRRTILLRQSDQIVSPLTYGIWRPVILLPKAMEYTNTSQLKYILTHELIHIKRFDILSKWLLAAALCVHWFNPFVWVMYILANRDIELACDESVVRKFGETKKSAYALTLISMVETRSKLTTMCTNFSKNSIEERILAIMKIKKTNIIGIVLALALVAGTSIAFATSAVETKSLGLFENVLNKDMDKYADHINNVTGESAVATTQDYSISIDSTIFTDHNVYAIIGLEGNVPEDFDISGRIVYSDIDQTVYGLAGDIKEIKPGDGVRYFLYSATIAETGTTPNSNEQLVMAAGNNFLKFNSLRDHEGTLLEITVNLTGSEHILHTTVDNVSTKALIFHPDAAQYDGDYFKTIILTPWELKMAGSSQNIYESANELPYIKAAIVLADSTKINMSYDTRGTVYDEGYPLAMSRGQNDSTGEFYHYWNFRGWELDLSQVTALIVDGVTYQVAR